MEPTNKPPVNPPAKGKTAVEFLSDADEMERTPIPGYARITVHVLAAALVTAVIWASVSDVDEVVVAKGRLVSPVGNMIVQPLETSIIQSIAVHSGQVVHKGDLLATLDPTFTKADEAQLQTRLGSLDNQIRTLEQELAGTGAGAADARDADSRLQAKLAVEKQANYEAQRTKMSETEAKLRAQMATNQADSQNLAQRVRSLREMEGMQEQLMAQHYGARLHVLEASTRRQDAERELQLATSRALELKRELAAFEAERSAFSKGWRQRSMEEMLAATRERDSVREQLQKADMRHKLVNLVAPADAIVLDIAKLSQGSIVKEAEAFFTLVPLNAPLEAEVQIDSVDVGYIKIGHVAHIKLDAFSYQRHGTLEAKVRTISEDAFRRESNNGGGLDAFYQSRIAFGAAHLKKMPPGTHLLPGMTLSAEIVVGKRSVMSYLLWPLTKALDESIREP